MKLPATAPATVPIDPKPKQSSIRQKNTYIASEEAADMFIRQKFRDIHWQTTSRSNPASPKKLTNNTGTDEYRWTEIITDSIRDTMEVSQ